MNMLAFLSVEKLCLTGSTNWGHFHRLICCCKYQS